MAEQWTIREGGLADPRVVELLELHVALATQASGICSAHALDVGELSAPEISFWSVWDDEQLLGFGALKELSPDHGEVKSMHVAERSRGRGVAAAIVRHIAAAARARGYSRISLETGSMDYFRAARALYRNEGFIECGPFGDYKLDPNTVFMSLELESETGA